MEDSTYRFVKILSNIVTYFKIKCKSISAWEDKRVFLVLVLSILLLLDSVENVWAYIGPGAGFAFLSSFLILFIAFALAIFYILSWPLRFFS